MTATNHPVFQAPDDHNICIWRYMDFTKYVSLLDQKSLFFARADILSLDDPYEGAISEANVRMRPIIYRDRIPDNAFNTLSKIHYSARRWTYINCWHMNNGESAAMWKLYSQINDAIAIKTTYQKLFDNLPDGVFVGIVHYIDYDNDRIPEGSDLFNYVHKRKSFEHEKELRALIQELPIGDKIYRLGRDMPHSDPNSTQNEPINYNRENPDKGRLIPVDLGNLINEVRVSPTSSDWYFNLVKRISIKHGLNVSVERSSLDKKPIF
jgi:hypothetical protein